MSDDLRTLATFTTFTEAALARNRLEAEGIPAVITDGQLVTMDYLLGNAIGWVKLQVREDDLERAGAVLAVGEGPLSEEEAAALASEAEAEPEFEEAGANGDADEESDKPEAGEPPAAEEGSARPAVERCVDLAYRASFVGLFLFCFSPFIHGYSFVLLLRVVRHVPEFSPALRRRFFTAFFIDLLALIAAFWLVVLFFLGGVRSLL